ncbi:glycosyltransferase [bacterium]|nr:glycosyltransferase [bacterium]
MDPSAARERPLRVLFSVGSLGAGGAERRLVELLQHIDRQRLSPALYLMERRGELLNEVPQDVPIDQWSRPGIKPSWPWRALGFLAPETARAWHLTAHLQKHPADIVVGWMLQSAYEAVSPTLQCDCPLVASSVVSPQADLMTAFGTNHTASRALAESTYRQADLILTNSVQLRNELIDFYQLLPEKVQAIPNLRDFQRIDQLANEEVQWPQSHPIQIVSAGRLHPQKGYLRLFDSMAILREKHRCQIGLTVLGEGPQRSELEQAIHSQNLTDCVHLLGYVANPYPYLRAADVFVLASNYEGLPNVLLEALALGTPVIATDCPTGPREILEDGRWGWLVPLGDTPAITEAITATLDDLPAACAQAREGAIAIRARHDIRTGVRRFEDVLIHTVRQYRQQRGQK